MSTALRALTVPTVFTLALVAGLAWLGNWQVERLAWKRDLIAKVTERPKLSPVAAPGPATWPSLDVGDYDYRPVTVTGSYRAGEIHVYTVLNEPNGPHGGQGFWVMAPFETAEGWMVVVNRGFVPVDRKDPASRPEAERPKGPATLTGLLRRPGAGAGNLFSPENDPQRNIWFTLDPGEIAAALGLPAEQVAPYTIDLVASMTPSGGLPQAGETRMRFVNNHLQYAVTWYGLALALAAVYGAFVWKRLRGR